MNATTRLLDRISDKAPRGAALLYLPLGEILTPLARGFFEEGVPIETERQSGDQCAVVGSDQVRQYRLTGHEGWADYPGIVQAFEERDERRRQEGLSGGRKTSPLPRDLVQAPLKLLIRDRDNPIECAVVTGHVYPKRAWIGTLHPALDPDWAYVVTAILNTPLGQLLYRRRARELGNTTHDLRKATLSSLRVPFVGLNPAEFSLVAALSRELHELYSHGRETQAQADHARHLSQRLLAEVVHLYGYAADDARALVEKVLPRGLRGLHTSPERLIYAPIAAAQPSLPGNSAAR